jgi:septal ring factor EnvC (AmiA/AmiB activator)
VFVNDNAHVRDQIVRLAFDFARSEQQSAVKLANTGQEQSTGASRYEALTQMSGKLDAQVQQTQQEIDSLRRQLDSATGRKRQDIHATIAETQSELKVIDAQRDVLHTMVEFVGFTTEGMGSTGLAAEVDALSHSVPAALTAPSSSTNRSEEGSSGGAIPLWIRISSRPTRSPKTASGFRLRSSTNSGS